MDKAPSGQSNHHIVQEFPQVQEYSHFSVTCSGQTKPWLGQQPPHLGIWIPLLGLKGTWVWPDRAFSCADKALAINHHQLGIPLVGVWSLDLDRWSPSRGWRNPGLSTRMPQLIMRMHCFTVRRLGFRYHLQSARDTMQDISSWRDGAPP